MTSPLNRYGEQQAYGQSLRRAGPLIPEFLGMDRQLFIDRPPSKHMPISRVLMLDLSLPSSQRTPSDTGLISTVSSSTPSPSYSSTSTI